MPKDYTLWQITCVVRGGENAHAASLWLEDNGAVNIVNQPIRANGAAHETPAPKKGARFGTNATGKPLSTIEKSKLIDEFVRRKFKGGKELTASELQADWLAAGFSKNVWNGLSGAVARKIIKKVKPGVYRGIVEKGADK